MTAELRATGDVSDVVEIPLSEARERLGDLVDSVRDEDSFIYLTRRGKRIAALMPVDIAENYEIEMVSLGANSAFWMQTAANGARITAVCIQNAESRTARRPGSGRLWRCG